jgi:hypothetical protein
MTTVTASYARDNNRIPITVDGIVTIDTQVLSGNNATVATPIFTIVGSVECRGLWAVVTTTLGVNQTAAYFRLNDQSAQTAITLATGTTISGAAVGSNMQKNNTSASTLTLLNTSTGQFHETGSFHEELQSFTVAAKNGATTNIEFVYSTTDTPTTGALQFFLRWIPLSANANVIAL